MTSMGKKRASDWLKIFVLILSLGWLLTIEGKGQDPATDSNTVKIAEQEKFVASDGVVIPWRERSRGCDAESAHPEAGCPGMTVATYIRSDMLTLYNQGGTLWYRFSVSSKSPDYFYSNTKMDFVPFSVLGAFRDYPDAIVLRLVAESENWYEVEVNEKTRATKFILKSDPMWSKVTWSFLFNWSYNVQVDQNRVKLLDKPNGEIIKETANAYFGKLRFEKLDGDWMYVGGIGDVKLLYKRYYGWIRWRKGREILIGSILNRNRIPETATDKPDISEH